MTISSTPAGTATEGAAETARPPDLSDPRLFINRELSWLEFNQRVLGEAGDRSLPVLERLKFLGITASNLDEFFMIRVAGLKRQISSGVAERKTADGMSPEEQLAAVSARAHRMVHDQYRLWRDELRPALEREHGVRIQPLAQLPEELRARAREFFRRKVYPVLTPLAIDHSHPFPQLRNKSITIAVQLPRVGARRRTRATTRMAVVGVPAALRRLVAVDHRTFVLLEDLVAEHAGDLFPGGKAVKAAAFRVTRNWDIEVDEEEAEDLLEVIQESVRARDRGLPVRVELTAPDFRELLTAELELGDLDAYEVDGPLQLQDLHLVEEALRGERRGPAKPRAPLADGIFDTLRKADALLHHPYDSFEPVVRFIDEAADDPDVRAIRQVLYRTGTDSPFVKALLRAAENGKEVVAFLEIKARFDEKNNIGWIEALKNAGAMVVYGYDGGEPGRKTHCKVSLVTRREVNAQGEEVFRHYAHVGTGNYNPVTARVYTDVSLLTADPEIGEDVHNLFNMLTANTGVAPAPWKRISVAPYELKKRLLALFAEQVDRARAGQPARIAAKMNSLVDAEVIRALYAASAAGVRVDLLVRGICCLRPGEPGVSDNVRVHQVVDRYLEHSRIFVFGVGDEARVFISSADWMPRNLKNRVEVMAPVDDLRLRRRLVDIVEKGLADNVKGSRLLPDGRYERIQPAEGAAPFRSQDALESPKRAANEELRAVPVAP